MILNDNETKIDLLNNRAIASTIIRLLRVRPDQPITIGVHGDWGAGKSSILEMIEAGFDGESKVLCLKINSWRFQGFEDAKIALIESIVIGLIEKRPALTKLGDTVKDIIRRIDWLKVAKKAGGLAFTAFTGVPTSDQIQTVLGILDGFIADPLKLATKDNIEVAMAGVKDLIKPKQDNSSTNVPEEITAFRKAFDDLLKKAGIEQLVVLIDDLDRCLPDIAIETLEALRLFMFTSHTAFVVAADEGMIEYAVRKHFPDLTDNSGSQSYARNYLEKLIQVPFRIPALGDFETRIYVTLLLVGAELGENDPEFSALIEVARELLKRPWDSSILDAATIKTTLGEKGTRVSHALALSDQIGPILAIGTKGNPRQIKRFLNTLVLRQQTAEARGFGSDIKLPILAKLMLAERFYPNLFDQVAIGAASAVDGKCAELIALETVAAVKADTDDSVRTPKVSAKGSDAAKPAVEKREVTKPTESVLLHEWLSSTAIKAWAAVPPTIGGEDLRPYLFIAKDRKDYFGVVSALGNLTFIVEQLFGGKLLVQGIESELKKLAEPEVLKIFEAMRGRIVGSDSFNTEPPGVAGLAVLIKAHPTLQGNLVDFLETLPHERLGPWVCSGWEGVLKDYEVRQRFDRLLSAWSKDGSKMLRIAADGVLRTRQGFSNRGGN